MRKIYFNDRFIGVAGLDSSLNNEGFEQIVVTRSKDIPNLVKYFDDTPSIVGLILRGEDQRSIFKALARCFTTIEAAGGLVTNERNEVLLISRLGRWDLPKGKVERREDVKDAAIREVREECGISPLEIESKICKTYHVYTIDGKRMFKTTHWFAMRYAGSQTLVPQTEESIVEARWVPADSLASFLSNTYQTIADVFANAEKME